MSPGVATPCPAAPPIPIAKVCFIAPSLTECRPFHCSPAHGRAQLKVRIPVSETPLVKNWLVFRVGGVYTQNFGRLWSTRDLGGAVRLGLVSQGRRRRGPTRNDSLRIVMPPKLSAPLPIWKLFLFARKEHTLRHEKQIPAQTRA